jgi:hypothetical protein
MNISRSATGTAILLASVLCFLCFSPSATLVEAKRGDAPHCQEKCLMLHSKRMRQLSAEYPKIANKMKYQDEVETEALNYSRCLTECRELLPIK